MSTNDADEDKNEITSHVCAVSTKSCKKAPVIFIMCVHPSVSIYKLEYYHMDFHKIWYRGSFTKPCQHIPGWFEIRQ
jgi:hypothetical protein